MKTTKRFTIKSNQTDFPNTKIASSEDAAGFIKSFYEDDIDVYESFFILLLDRSNTTIGYAKISQGGVSGTVVDVKIVAKYAVDSLASGVILAHNHPSGNLVPSDSDIAITKKVKKGLELLDINVVDHVILSKKGYYSMSDYRFL